MTESLLTEKLKQNDPAAYSYVYDTCFPAISAWIQQNSGTREDAADIFQEAMIVLVTKLQQPDFTLTAAVKTYLFSVARNTWLKQLRDTPRIVTADIPETAYITEPDIRNYSLLLRRWLQRITGHCQRILKALFFYRVPVQTLMQQMGWKNKHTSDNQKYKCLQQLRKASRQDPG
ncbi:sigma-70 family RNA polymerase sigma factor [Chitinophaga sp. Mgbs1]|uniref:Sigma-70 family RNA polymerase sigma factor n=1 Tax=Chitinophaga solisilvae TaxID=1233460 RepID=A0A3S1JF05_9BACT|nr:sigma-70 family RNA polymerase sigma factor [Chitinophaga solisilvae]